MKRRGLVVLALLAGCGGTKAGAPDSSVGGTSDAGDAPLDQAAQTLDVAEAPEVQATDGSDSDRADAGLGADAGDAAEVGAIDAADAAPAALVLPPECASSAVPPLSLVCTGLYANIATKQIAPGNAPYAPAVPLWSDGATKQRWISLPAGTKIDNTDPNEWVFPIGTKVWKEFSRDGKRVETRLWQKVDATYWVDAAYAWTDDESSATRTDGGDIPWGDGGTYHIPTPDECQQCHRGRTDRLLGFEQGLLGLAGATGLTLEQLATDGRLTVPPPKTPLVIGDDGTGLAAPALAWLHVNCGTTCHNNNSSSTAWATGLFMRLDAAQLDGRSVKGFDTLTTTFGVAAVSPAFRGKTRIVAHDPAHSLLYQLISHRGTGIQMPPIATNVVDEADIPLVEAWIEQLSPPASDGGTDGSTHTEAGAESNGSHDGHVEAGDDAEPADDGGVDVDTAVDAGAAD
jgi:hypothetical protein